MTRVWGRAPRRVASAAPGMFLSIALSLLKAIKVEMSVRPCPLKTYIFSRAPLPPPRPPSPSPLASVSRLALGPPPQQAATHKAVHTASGRCENRCSIFLPILTDPPVREDLSIIYCRPPAAVGNYSSNSHSPLLPIPRSESWPWDGPATGQCAGAHTPVPAARALRRKADKGRGRRREEYQQRGRAVPRARPIGARRGLCHAG